uniref:Hypotheticial protein n=1 Tax=Schistosoma japonicum TaxID=6182 RepID=C7TYL9_SCHJA|nr:hypotheticial protein [Schistosoma japonicum]
MRSNLSLIVLVIICFIFCAQSNTVPKSFKNPSQEIPFRNYYGRFEERPNYIPFQKKFHVANMWDDFDE